MDETELAVEQKDPFWKRWTKVSLHTSLQYLGVIISVLWVHLHFLEHKRRHHVEVEEGGWPMSLLSSAAPFIAAFALDWYGVGRWWRARVLALLCLGAFVSYGVYAIWDHTPSYSLFWPLALLIVAILTEWHVITPHHQEDSDDEDEPGGNLGIIAFTLLAMNSQKETVKKLTELVFNFIYPQAQYTLTLAAILVGVWLVVLGLLHYHPLEVHHREQCASQADPQRKTHQNIPLLLLAMFTLAAFLASGRTAELLLQEHICRETGYQSKDAITFLGLLPSLIYSALALALTRYEHRVEAGIVRPWMHLSMLPFSWILVQTLAIALSLGRSLQALHFAWDVLALVVSGCGMVLGYLSWSVIMDFMQAISSNSSSSSSSAISSSLESLDDIIERDGTSGPRTWLTAGYALVHVFFWKREHWQAFLVDFVRGYSGGGIATISAAIAKGVQERLTLLVLSSGSLFVAMLLLVALVIWRLTKPLVVQQRVLI